MRDVIQLIAWIPLLAAAALGGVAVSPRLQLLDERLIIVGSLAPFGVPLAALALGLLAAGRARPLGLAIALSVLVVHLVIARPYWPGPAPEPSSTMTVMTMNMRCNSPGDEALIRLLGQGAPEVAVVNGVSERSRTTLTEELAGLYPHAVFAPMPSYPECGTVVLSRVPLDGWATAQRHPTGFVRGSGFGFTLVAVDLPTPTDGAQQWAMGFEALAGDISRLAGTPVMAIGDFNAVLEHQPMRGLMRETGLKDAVTGSGLGWLPTFPDEGRVPPLVAIDHVLVSEGIAAKKAWTAEVPGQQHRALFVTLGPVS